MDNLTAFNASEYDLKVRQTIPFYDTIHREVIRLVKLVRPEVKCWVDTGCGTGYLVEQALVAFPRTQFLLADPSEAMLVQTRARLARTANERIAILPATDTAGLGSHITPGTAGVVTAIQCHHYLKQAGRMKALQACFVTLEPGGLFVTFENVAPRSEDGVRFGLRGWKSFLVAQGRTGEEADKQVARYGTEFFPITAEQHLRSLMKVGFKVVELFWFSQMQAGFFATK
jgi:tRNA (cmo5U34)-methyltransferase